LNSFHSNKKIFSDKQDYWTYNGSLTTPPCCECVIWTVFCHPLKVSTSQMNVLRSLLSMPIERIDSSHPQLVNNFRPTQSLNGRIVRRSFR
uniref:carbonic anhydrase n=1 Tax=Soboliphyme baturini TaxID=241478 RepID=A0A183IUN7_9BILA